MKNKNIQFSNHAEIQMNERNIDKLMVLETLKNPLQIFSSKNDRRIAQKIFKIEDKDFLLRVIYEDFNNIIKVITAYLTTKIKKFVRGINEN